MDAKIFWMIDEMRSEVRNVNARLEQMLDKMNEWRAVNHDKETFPAGGRQAKQPHAQETDASNTSVESSARDANAASSEKEDEDAEAINNMAKKMFDMFERLNRIESGSHQRNFDPSSLQLPVQAGHRTSSPSSPTRRRTRTARESYKSEALERQQEFEARVEAARSKVSKSPAQTPDLGRVYVWEKSDKKQVGGSRSGRKHFSPRSSLNEEPSIIPLSKKSTENDSLKLSRIAHSDFGLKPKEGAPTCDYPPARHSPEGKSVVPWIPETLPQESTSQKHRAPVEQPDRRERWLDFSSNRSLVRRVQLEDFSDAAGSRRRTSGETSAGEGRGKRIVHSPRVGKEDDRAEDVKTDRQDVEFNKQSS
ncbi:hypothetical protein GUITHDRAFT_104641 [Guillardia theta CCMP2712]|uniref:Uncharacterized protein n=1 Tax=Guillardia theta (strain CCMP2712) TaxID=905079 RepID=L1JNM2_GUITC|nr:hypothetical protein GUITHDRAFT_104641 [Guillardia theta CCMP2712]EKX49678.1 hypothetical protein GUITHDRAFT_104641 [Guillardia theta CCMP2712]|eukprot:XP_005836658.1 hypothetical protein GUITHDRAFT_104641 [Guillardia theta CCMP2712]